MAFKRNEPGCQCCGFGLAANPGDILIDVLVKGTGDILLAQSTAYNVTTNFGSGAVVCGSDPERGRILIRQTSGQIRYVESRTFATGLLFDSTSDVGGLSVYYLYYQHSYGHAGGYYVDGSNLKGFTVSGGTGNFVVPVFTFPSIFKYFLEPQQNSVSCSVDPSGNLYAGCHYDSAGLGKIQFLKNGAEHTYVTPHDGTSITAASNPLSVLPQFSAYANGNVYNYISRSSHAELDNISEKAGPGQLTTGDLIFSVEDTTGESDPVEGRIRAFTQYNPATERFDYLINTKGWYRVSKNLDVNVLMYNSGKQIFVTHPSS